MVKKPRYQELLFLIEDVRHTILQAHVNYDIPDPFGGHCQENEFIAHSLHGQTWDSRKPSSHGKHGHTVCVMSTKGSNSAHIVDITQTPAIVGQVPDIRDATGVASALEQTFGLGGWVRRKTN